MHPAHPAPLPSARALPLRVGTRRSPLARVQTRAFLAWLAGACPALRGPEAFEEHAIQTTGDAVQERGLAGPGGRSGAALGGKSLAEDGGKTLAEIGGRSGAELGGKTLAELGGKGLFAKEVHEALLDARIDCAVHSLKDLETVLPAGIVLACTLAREDARDVLIPGPGCFPVDPAEPWRLLPPGAVVGTSSVRRRAQLLHARPDLRVAALRGNVQTRLDRLAAGACTATLLAAAGLRRLGLRPPGAVALPPAVMLPAACQGIIGVTVRAADSALRELLGGIEDSAARAVATAERALLAALDGSCRTPIGGHAELLADGTLTLAGLVARADGTFLLRRTLTEAAGDAAQLGHALGASLRADSPGDLFV